MRPSVHAAVPRQERQVSIAGRPFAPFDAVQSEAHTGKCLCTCSMLWTADLSDVRLCGMAGHVAHIHVQYSQPPRTEDTISYNACITACERGGRWQEALACLHAHHSVHSFHENRDLTKLAVKAMSARSILINTVSYNAVPWFAYAQN